jgi:hypothetical protein
MTFLNPLVLFGLAAASIPLILHLLNLRKLRTIEFSSLRFLKELQKTSMRRIRVRQILLLIVRTLLVIALVIAFSRPTLHGSFAALGGGNAGSTMVVLLDDSPSMTVRDERGSSFARAQQSAMRIADLAQEGDKVYLLPLSEVRPGAELPAARTAASFRAAVERLLPTFFTTSYAAALREAGTILATSADANREVVLITDGQATQFGVTGGAPDSTAALDARSRVFVVSSPSRRRDNAAVGPAGVITRILAGRKPVRLSAGMSNFGDAPLTGSSASVYLDGSRVAQRSVDLPSRGTVEKVFQFSPARRGILGGHVEIEDDLYEPDNRWFYTLSVPENINILLTGPDDAATGLAALALTLAGDTSLAGSLSVQRSSEEGLGSIDLGKYDVVILCGVHGFGAPGARRIARFVQSGGGLMIFPGAASAVSLYNEQLLPALSLPRWSSGPVTQAPGAYLTFGKVDFGHPLFEGLFDRGSGIRKKQPVIESPRIVTALPLSAGERGAAVIALSNGWTFLADYGAGNGRVLVCAVEAGLGWSDFPMKGIFAPLLHRAVMYLASRGGEQPAFTAGEQVHLAARLRDFSDRDTYSVTGPDGTTQRIVPSMQPGTGAALFALSPPPEPGVYTVVRDMREGERAPHAVAAAAVNVDRSESDLRTATDDELAAFWQRMGISGNNVRVVGADQSPVTMIREARFGVELWKHCLALAVFLALAEMALGRTPRQDQPGSSAG